jgi:hypothetical protein
VSTRKCLYVKLWDKNQEAKSLSRIYEPIAKLGSRSGKPVESDDDGKIRTETCGTEVEDPYGPSCAGSMVPQYE